jgi:hypothetical protein
MWNFNKPFRFEDLPLDAKGRRVEPASFGPIYSKPLPKPKRVNDETRIPTNAPSGQKGPIVDDAQYRAMLKAKLAARCNADRKAWAEGKLTIKRPGFSGNIVAAYKQAMSAKRARIAAELARRKPHYVLRAGEWKLAA